MTFNQKRDFLIKSLNLTDLEFAHLMRIKGLADKISSKIIEAKKEVVIKEVTKSKVVNKNMSRTHSERMSVEKVDPIKNEVVRRYKSIRTASIDNEIGHTTLYLHMRKDVEEPINGFIYRFCKYIKTCNRCGVIQNTNNTYKTKYRDKFYFRPNCKKCEKILKEEKAKINN